MRRTRRSALSIFLSLALLLTLCAGTLAWAAPAGKIRVVRLDCGRKYFSVPQIKEILDEMAQDGYTHLELAVGNNGCRFLLDDMHMSANEVSYSSDQIRHALLEGNRVFYDDPNGNALTQAEMDELFSYAGDRGISLYPMMNTPGHCNAMVTAMQLLGVKDSEAESSMLGQNLNMDLYSAKESNFIRKLLGLYMAYFQSKGCSFFNMAADEVPTKDRAKYDLYTSYVNTLAAQVKRYGMRPIMFNDGIYYDGRNLGQFDKDIIVAYWIPPVGDVEPVASPETIRSQGHDILNSSFLWYYVVGVNEDSSQINYNPFSYHWSKRGMKAAPYSTLADGTKDPEVLGAVVSIWCDTPKYRYDSAKVLDLIRTFPEQNPALFSENT